MSSYLNRLPIEICSIIFSKSVNLIPVCKSELIDDVLKSKLFWETLSLISMPELNFYHLSMIYSKYGSNFDTNYKEYKYYLRKYNGLIEAANFKGFISYSFSLSRIKKMEDFVRPLMSQELKDHIMSTNNTYQFKLIFKPYRYEIKITTHFADDDDYVEIFSAYVTRAEILHMLMFHIQDFMV